MSAPKEVPHEDELVDYDEDAAEQTIDAVEKKAAPKAKEVTRSATTLGAPDKFEFPLHHTDDDNRIDMHRLSSFD